MHPQETVTAICKGSLKLIHEYISKIKTIEEIKNFLVYINTSIRIIRKALRCKIHRENILENANSLETSLAYLKFYRFKLLNKKKTIVSKNWRRLF